MRAFLWIVVAGIGCALLGGGFGWLLGWIAPEFLEMLAQPYPVAGPARLGLAVGMVAGLLLGAAAMAFGQLVEAIRGRGRLPNPPSTDYSAPQCTPDENASWSATSVRPERT
jgi:hypothetical protein